MGWREDRNATKSGTLSARHQNAIPMAFRWRADNGPPLNAGLVALRFLGAKKPYVFVILGGGGVRTPCSPSGSAHVRE